jgi:nucleotide-binding universal stress UspA family protein
MRTYLVVIDETAEAEVALRFAARRALKTAGAVEILVVMDRAEFVAWGGIQATMEAEAREHAEEVVARALDTLGEEGALTPAINVRQGTAAGLIREAIEGNPDIAALVLGAAPGSNPGPLVSHFTGNDAGNLPVPIMLVPGALSREALDRLS